MKTFNFKHLMPYPEIYYIFFLYYEFLSYYAESFANRESKWHHISTGLITVLCFKENKFKDSLHAILYYVYALLNFEIIFSLQYAKFKHLTSKNLLKEFSISSICIKGDILCFSYFNILVLNTSDISKLGIFLLSSRPTTLN